MKYRCSHSLCNAHHIRELTAVYEPGGQVWAQQMIGLLLESKQTVEQAKRTGKKKLPLCDIRKYESRYKAIIASGMKANPSPIGQTAPENGPDQAQQSTQSVGKT